MVSESSRRAVTSRSSTSGDGYNLVILIMVLTVMNIMVAAALPLWSHAAKREKEEELIFRGLQYAEAVRVFQRRHGRPPTSLEELIKVKPRSIRRLWKDPMSESGEWGLLLQGGAPQAAQKPGAKGQPTPNPQQQARIRANQRAARGAGEGAAGGQAGSVQNPAWQRNMERLRPHQGQVVAVPPGGSSGRDRGRRVTTGPIVGVYSATSESAAKSFAGADSYDQWRFTIDLIPQPAVVPGVDRILRSRNDWIGRPFREGLQPVLGPRAGGARGQELTRGGAPGSPAQTRGAARGRPAPRRQQRR